MRMLEQGEISVSMCPVYNTDLAYLFYGRPAYKPAQGLAPSGIIELAPVCLIVDPSLIASAVRLLPFDSGGFKRYENIIGPGHNLVEFELGPDPTSAQRTVSTFFDTNRNYYEQKPTLSEAAISFADMTARGYARLIADGSIRADDDRCATVEVQFSAPVALDGALRGIVAPATVLEDPIVSSVLARSAGVIPLSYKLYGRTDTIGLMYALYERVETFLTDAGSLS